MPSGSSPVLPANSTVVYTAIAASDGLGIGSTGECFLFEDCPNGKGYVQVAGQQLRARGYMISRHEHLTKRQLVEEGPGPGELSPPSALREVARHGHKVWGELSDRIDQGLQDARIDPPEMEIR